MACKGCQRRRKKILDFAERQAEEIRRRAAARAKKQQMRKLREKSTRSSA